MQLEPLIIGEIREFKKSTLERLDVIEKKVDSLKAFQARVMGVAAFCAFLATLLVEWVRGR